MGLRLVWQPRPLCPALYAISVRRLGTLPAASFRFHLAMDTLAVRLTLPTTKRVVDFHHQAIAHAGRNRVGGCPLIEQPTSHTTVRTVRYTAVQS